MYTDERFLTALPVIPSAVNSAGFRGRQGFSGTFNNVTYPEVSTPLGTKPVLRITFRGQTETIDALDETTTPWAFAFTEYSNAGIRVTGTWTGTLTFERSTDGGTNWASFNVTRTSDSASVSSTTANGTFQANTTGATELLRVKATAWTSGSATVSVGMAGGQAAARMNAGNFNANQGRIYTRLVYRTSANWSMNGNTGAKLFFFRQLDGDNHYVNLGGTSVTPNIALQPSRSDPGIGTFSTAHGEWLDVEIIFEANTPGTGNGIGRAWVNGVLCVERTDFSFFDTGDTVQFTEFLLDPTYGGGLNPPPEDISLDIAYWYRESAA